MSLQKLQTRIEQANSMVCVGLDPDYDKLPERFNSEDTPLFEFNKWIIDQTYQSVCAYKPNTAFYEAQGEHGWYQLRLTMEYLSKNYPDIFTICDAKRADIGNTNNGYVQAIFDDLGFDAITLHPYLGQEALQPFLDRADKTCIILCKTSNPGSDEFQDMELDLRRVPLWHYVAEQVADKWNQNQNCMLVTGATYPAQLKQIRQIVGSMPLLVPGIGAQGGDLQAVLEAGLSEDKKGLVINSSRGIIFADNPAEAVEQLKRKIELFVGD